MTTAEWNTALNRENEELRLEVQRLKTLISALPTTADGVPIVPGMTVFVCPKTHWLEYVVPSVTKWGVSDCFAGSEIYSTREAAEASRLEVKTS
jgi:hypothetical protein